MKRFLKKIVENKWLFLILAIASFLRIYHLDFQSLWMDEIYTMNISSPDLTFKQFHEEMILREGFPYLYFLLLKIMYFFFGYTSFVARFLSVIGGLLAVFLIYKIAKKLVDYQTGLIAALLLAINEYQIYISQDARPYTLYLAAIIFSYYRLIFFIEKKDSKTTIYYGLSAGILLNINFFSLINLLSQAILIIIYFSINKEIFLFKNIKKFIIVLIIAAIMFLPNIDMLLKLLQMNNFWVERPNSDSFNLMFKEFLGNYELTIFIITPILIYFLATIFNYKSSFTKEALVKKVNFSILILFTWIFVFMLFLIIRSYGDVSLILSRYFTSIIPVVILVIAWGISCIKNQIAKTIVLFSLATLTFTNIFYAKNYYNTTNKSQFREASNHILKNNTNKDCIFTTQKYWFDYYFRSNNVDLKEKKFEDVIQEMIKDTTKIKSFWYIEGHGKQFQPEENIKLFMNKYFYVDSNFDGFQSWAKHFELKSNKKQLSYDAFNRLKKLNDITIESNIDVFEINNNTLHIYGWAIEKDIPSEDIKTEIIIYNERGFYVLPTEERTRKDVTISKNNKINYDSSGFETLFLLTEIPKGNYKTGIYLYNKSKNKEKFKITDKVFKNNY